jgi:hypothetical protein
MSQSMTTADYVVMIVVILVGRVGLEPTAGGL